MTKPSDYKTDAEFIAVARERLARTLSNDRLPVQPWLAEALRRLEAANSSPTCADCRFCDTDYICRADNDNEEVATEDAACSLFEPGEPMEAAHETD